MLTEPLLQWGPALWLTGLLAVGTLAAFILSVVVERAGPIRLRHWAEKSNGRLLELYNAENLFDAFRLILSMVARLLPVVLTWTLWQALLSRPLDAFVAAGAAVGGVALYLFILEWSVRWILADHTESALQRLTGPLRTLSVLLVPGIWLLGKTLPSSAENEDDEEEASDDEIDAYIDVGVREGILEPEEEELVRSIVDFGDTQVRSVMTPRVEVVSVPVTATQEEVCERFFESKHARLPVYKDSVDEIVGILHIRDLFAAMQNGGVEDLSELTNQPYYVPETKPLRQLLEEMQKMHQQMAIVIDEYGGVAGLVTVEDLLEEIVGEISDEHEEAQDDEHLRLGEDHWRLAGRTELEELEELFGIDPDDLPYETVSGLICGELGYVPKARESFIWQGLRFDVEQADERRVMSVDVHRAAEALVERQ